MSVRLPPLPVLERQNSFSSLSSDPYNRNTRRAEIRRGKTLLQAEELADKTWRQRAPREREREREEFINKLGPLRTLRNSRTRSNPSMSPRVNSRQGVHTPVSMTSYAGVTDPEYMSSMERRLIYDRQKAHFREKSNIFPTEKDYAEANKKSAHSPRAVSYVPALAKQSVKSITEALPPKVSGKLDPLRKDADSIPITDRSLKKQTYTRKGPTQYHSNTGIVMVMKPPQHALVGTVYENRPLKQEYYELKQFRMHPENIMREDTDTMLERCDRLLNPTADSKKPRKEPLVTPTDWNRSISRSPNLQDLRSQLPENASPFMIQELRQNVEQNRKEHVQAVVTAMSLQKVMRPDGRPLEKHYVDSMSKCMDWLQKNFS